MFFGPEWIIDSECMAYSNAEQLNSSNILIDMCLITQAFLMTMWYAYVCGETANSVSDSSTALSACDLSEIVDFSYHVWSVQNPQIRSFEEYLGCELC